MGLFMNEKFKYVEYEKLSDAVIAWENGEPLYRKRSGEWVYLDHDNFCYSVKYAKRVELEEKTVEVWAAVAPSGNIWGTSSDEIGLRTRYSRHSEEYKIVKLTGTYRE